MWKIGWKSNSKALQSLSFLPKFDGLSLYSSTCSKNKTFAEYLEQFLGFSKQQSLSISTKLSKERQMRKTQNVSTFNFENANYVLNFLKNRGFKDAHVRKIVSLSPRILLSNVDKTLKPKLDILKEIGLCGTHLADFVYDNPYLLHRNVGPSLQPLRSVLGSNENVVLFLKRVRLFFVSKVGANNLISNARVLEKEYGFCSDVIRNEMLKTPSSFMTETDLFRSRLVRVEKEGGIPRYSSMFFTGLQVLSSQKSMDSKFGVFKDYGWTQLDVLNLFRQIPHCLALSEGTLRKKLDFFMKELGYEAAYLVSHPSLLTCSLEKRVLPRRGILLVLKQKGLLDGQNFNTVVCSSEAKFLKKFVLPFEDIIPGLYELYLNSKGGAEDGSGKKRMFKSRAADGSGLHVLSSQKSMESKFGVFRDYGWTQLDVMNLFRQIPRCLAFSEGTLRKKLDFFMKELGYEAAYLVSHPSLLTFSLKKRVLPRRRILLVLKQKGLLDGRSFPTVVCLSEAKFLQKFVLPYEDVIPDLYELYLNSRGGAGNGSVKKRMFKSRAAA